MHRRGRRSPNSAGSCPGRSSGSLQLFEKLTGSEQLWWRCCRDAAQIQPYWLLDGDHDKALQVISDTELVLSRGVVSRAARAADLVCRALAEPASRTRPLPALSDVVKRAADCWDGSPALLIPERGQLCPGDGRDLGCSSFAGSAPASTGVPRQRQRRCRAGDGGDLRAAARGRPARPGPGCPDAGGFRAPG